MHKVKNDILFIIIVIFLFALIALFNYLVDPFNLFHNKSRTKLISIPIEFSNIYMKMCKKENMVKVIFGSSDIDIAISSSLFNEYHKMTVRGINYKQYYNLIKSHFDLHPETKYVIFGITYTDITGSLKQSLPKYTGSNLNKDEIIRLLFSYQTTSESIKRVKRKTEQNFDNLFCYPRQLDLGKKSLTELVEEQNERFFYLEKIISFLKDKKVNYIFIIPPYNAIYLSFIKNTNIYEEQVINLKKFLVANDIEVYDFAFVNKHIAKSLFDAPYLNYNFNHPSSIWGNKIYKNIFYGESGVEKLYMLLTKENIDEVIEYQKQLLNEFELKNSEVVKLHKELHFNPKPEDFSYSIVYRKDEIPSEYLKWFEE